MADITNAPNIHWEFLDFPSLDTARLYAILRARCEVFITEQKCPYSEMDGLDQKAYHLIGWVGPDTVAVYLRLIAPGVKYDEPSIGRVLTAPPYRKMGLARRIMHRALEEAGKLYPGRPMRISAQTYLEKFYQELGFKTISEPYDDVGIPHIDMLLGKI